MWVETVMKQLFPKAHLNYAARSGSEYWTYLESGPTSRRPVCALLKVAEVSADPGEGGKNMFVSFKFQIKFSCLHSTLSKFVAT